MAEGIKISEFDEAETLQDGCCFPIVSDGENKRITKRNLFNQFVNNFPMNGFKSTIRNMFFPVGSKISSTTNPANFIGGTWSSQSMGADTSSQTGPSVGKTYVLEGTNIVEVYLWTRTA